MKTFHIVGLVATLTMGLAQPAAAQQLAAGAESTVTPPAGGAAMKVFLPVNYQPDVKWPVIFFYHGQGGSPTTAVIRHHTADRDFIVVGLPYVTPDSDRPMPDFASREAQNFHAARAWLAAHASVDEGRVYLGGLSKGGWTASLLGEPELPRLAGLIILLAGRSYPFTTLPGGAAYRGKPIYIGDGETDRNMRPARQATTFFQLQGAAVTFEEYPGLGHAMPPEAPRLQSWLRVQGRYHAQDPATLAEVGQWFTNAVAAARAATDDGEQFRLALDLLRDPRLALAGAPAAATAQALLKAATTRSPGREEWTAENTYWALLWKVTNLRSLEDLRSTRDGFKKLTDSYPASRWGQLAVEDYRVLSDAYNRTVGASTTNQTTHAGVNNRGIPVPRWSGNKIIFDR